MTNEATFEGPAGLKIEFTRGPQGCVVVLEVCCGGVVVSQSYPPEDILRFAQGLLDLAEKSEGVVKRRKRTVRDSWQELSQHWPEGSELAQSDALREAWLAHWKTRKRKIGSDSVRDWSKTFSDWGLKESIAALKHSKKQGYIAIVRDPSSSTPKPTARPGDYRSGSVKSWDRTVNK